MSNMAQTVIPQAASAINVKDVSKIFYQKQPPRSARDIFIPYKKEIKALDHVSFAIQKGEFTAYAGPNGAGKSTTIKLLSGMLTQTDGELTVLGLSPRKDRIKLMRRVGILFGNRSELWWDHPISASFRWKQQVWGIDPKAFSEMEKMVLELLDIAPFYNTFARELSLGQRMRADLGLMLLHDPELILLDEPTLGLDVLAKRQMIAFLKRLNHDKNTTIVVTSHDMDDLEEMANRILLIANGRIAFDGNFESLRSELRMSRIAEVTYEDGHKKNYTYEDTQAMLGLLSQQTDIADIRFLQTPLEEGIANLYQTWR